MAFIRFLCKIGTTQAFLTSLGGTVGTPNPAGYIVTQVAHNVHQITVTGLSGPFYLGAANAQGSDGIVPRIDLLNADILFDTTIAPFANIQTELGKVIKTNEPTLWSDADEQYAVTVARV